MVEEADAAPDGTARCTQYGKVKTILDSSIAVFPGSHLCEMLLEDGCTALCLDNFSTGARRNVGHLLNCPNVELMRHDVPVLLYVEVDEIDNRVCPTSTVHTAALG